MKEQEIVQLIAAEQRRRQEADREHLLKLAREQGGDLKGWCARRRMAARAVAAALLVAVPSVYTLLLPERKAAAVLCNQRGEEMLVLNRACSTVGNCENRQLNVWMHTMNEK